jgi:hypothetical protein
MSFVKGPSPEFLITTLRRPLGVLQGYARTLKYVMERSLTNALVRKYRITVPKVYRRYRAVLDTEHGPRPGLRVTLDAMAEGCPSRAPRGGSRCAAASGKPP